MTEQNRGIETRLWINLLTLHGILFRRMNRAMLQQYGITLAKFDVLAQLTECRDGISLSVLSQRLKVTGGNVTGLVKRLIADGLVSRQMSGSDKRSFIIRLTEEGTTTFLSAREYHDRLIREWLGSIPQGNLDSALASLESLRAYIQSTDDRKAMKGVE